MKSKIAGLFAGAFLAAVAVSTVADAQQPAAQPTGTPVRLRGTVDALNGNVLSMTTTDGQKIDVKLADNFQVLTTVGLKLADIKDNSYIGSAAIEENGQLKAIEVFVMPEANRGAGEGHYPWDLGANSTMTNGNVDKVEPGAQSVMMHVSYKDGTKDILVTADTPIVTFQPGTVADVKPGLFVFVGARKQDDGTYTAGAVRVEKDGVKPPM